MGQNRMKYLLAAVIVLVLAGCDAKPNSPSPFLKMNSVMKTHCIGRSLVDLPEGYALKSGALGIFVPDQDDVKDAKIDLLLASRVDAATFEKEVAARHAELIAADGGTTNKLTHIQKLENGGTLFRVRVINDAYKTQIHFMSDDNYLVAKIKSYNNQVLKSEALLIDFVKRIGSANSIESVSDFCLGDVVVKGQYRSESATLLFADPAVPDIVFSADVNTYVVEPQESLLQRLDGPNSLLKKFDVRESVLRKGERKVANMRAQEWLASVKLGENRDQKQLGFNLETIRPNPSPATPKIHLEMEVTGSHAMDEKGAIQLWDSVTGSIRSRQSTQ
jgi:hypothetical protein